MAGKNRNAQADLVLDGSAVRDRRLPLVSAPQPLDRVPTLQPDARGPQREEDAAADHVRRVARGDAKPLVSWRRYPRRRRRHRGPASAGSQCVLRARDLGLRAEDDVTNGT